MTECADILFAHLAASAVYKSPVLAQAHIVTPTRTPLFNVSGSDDVLEMDDNKTISYA